MSEVAKISLSVVDANPMRHLDRYPFNEEKIEALMASIAAVGLWEGVIGRKKGNRVQIAFGHHRVEAARRQLGEKAKVSIIVRDDLDDEKMIQFMGRENLEDWNADLLVMLESWEAVEDYLGRDKKPQPIVTARLLGWTRHSKSAATPLITKTADTCQIASKLIAGGHMAHADLEGLSVQSAYDLCSRVASIHAALDKMTGRHKPADLKTAKAQVGRAGKKVASDVRSGAVAPRDIRGKIDLTSYDLARKTKARAPMLEAVAKDVANRIEAMVSTDATAEKLTQIVRAIPDLTPEDREHLGRIDLELGNLSERAARWRSKLDPKARVVQLKEIS